MFPLKRIPFLLVFPLLTVSCTQTEVCYNDSRREAFQEEVVRLEEKYDISINTDHMRCMPKAAAMERQAVKLIQVQRQYLSGQLTSISDTLLSVSPAMLRQMGEYEAPISGQIDYTEYHVTGGFDVRLIVDWQYGGSEASYYVRYSGYVEPNYSLTASKAAVKNPSYGFNAKTFWGSCTLEYYPSQWFQSPLKSFTATVVNNCATGIYMVGITAD